jgi:hypothetical protein
MYEMNLLCAMTPQPPSWETVFGAPAEASALSVALQSAFAQQVTLRPTPWGLLEIHQTQEIDQLTLALQRANLHDSSFTGLGEYLRVLGLLRQTTYVPAGPCGGLGGLLASLPPSVAPY